MTAPRFTRSFEGYARSFDAAPAPAERPLSRPPVRLRVVPDPTARRAHRRMRALTALVGVAAAIGLFGIVVVHVLLAQGQGDVQQLQAKVQQEASQQQRLQVTVAQLESPERVVSAAKGKLGMVTPATVVALAPASLADPPATTIPAPKPTTTTVATTPSATPSTPPSARSSGSSTGTGSTRP